MCSTGPDSVELGIFLRAGRNCLMLSLALMLFCWGLPTLSSNDEFADARSHRRFVIEGGELRLVLKGELELELHDLQGSGGRSHDSQTDTQTLGTRSPFVEVDTFWLAPRLELLPGLSLYSVLEFTQRGAGVRSAWFDYQVTGPSFWRHHVEVGLHTPIIKIERRTERYPLIATAFWRRPEAHVAYQGQVAFSPNLTLAWAGSVGFMRPLTGAPVAESDNQTTVINVVAFGSARPFSGNGPIAGGYVKLTGWGVSATGFGFLGTLSAAEGTDQLRALVTRYRELAGKPSGSQARAYFWGGRLQYHDYGVHLIAEFLSSELDRFQRWGAYVQASYEIPLLGPRYVSVFEPIVRLEVYRILRTKRVLASGRSLRAVSPIFATAWDFDVLTVAGRLSIIDQILNLRLEYYWIGEHNGVPNLDLKNNPIANNELLAQIEVRF